MILKYTRYFIAALLLLVQGMHSTASYANNTAGDSTLFTNMYNSVLYSTVIDAAKKIASPFLLQQGYLSDPSIAVLDTSLIYKGVTYPVSQSYNINRKSGFYLTSSVYSNYGINNFHIVWPTEFPNIDFNAGTKTFKSQVDCVGYGTRVLSAVGDTSISGNAYASLVNQVTTANVADIAAAGRAADSYQLATAFATLKTAVPGWQYITGNVEANAINTYNHTLNANLNTYTGVRKGGFTASKAGDMLEFGNGPNASSSGHTMIIDTTPQLLDATGLKPFFPTETINNLTAFVALHHIYSVSIFDDCDIRHFNDSRTTINGIGHGIILIVTDTLDDAPIGFVFGPSTITPSAYTPLDTIKTFAITVARYSSAVQLPVALLSFIVQGVNLFNGNINTLLSWQTESEINTAHFNIQRSTNGKEFTTIQKVNAKGASEYSYNDITTQDVLSQLTKLYYRLEIVDKNGSKTYSDIRELSIINYPLSITPNPAKNYVSIKGNHIISVQIINTLGKMVYSKRFSDVINPIIYLNNLLKGEYYIRIQTIDNGLQTLKMVKE